MLTAMSIDVVLLEKRIVDLKHRSSLLDEVPSVSADWVLVRDTIALEVEECGFVAEIGRSLLF